MLQESAHRYETVSQINDNVMKTIRRDSRKLKAQRVVRLLAFCFVMPFSLLLPALAFLYVPHSLSIGTIAVGVSLLFFYIPVIIRLNEVFRSPVL